MQNLPLRCRIEVKKPWNMDTSKVTSQLYINKVQEKNVRTYLLSPAAAWYRAR